MTYVPVFGLSNSNFRAISAQTGLNWFLLSFHTAKPSTKKRNCCYNHPDFWTKYFFFLRYDDVYRAEGHTHAKVFSTMKIFMEVALLAAYGGFF